MTRDEIEPRRRALMLRAFGPCPCGCGEPRRKNRRTATDTCQGVPLPEGAE